MLFLYEWNEFIIYVLTGLIGGFSSGLIGAGCGHIIVSVLVYKGVHPRVATATSGFQTVFVGGSAIV